MDVKRFLCLGLCLALCCCLCGCTSPGMPITDPVPSVTLPPAEVSHVAPIGDAALKYSEDAVLYLPSRDGISLTGIETSVSYSPVRPKAETLVRALLAHKGNTEAEALGGDVRLSLYGTSPVEVSRDVVTVNLSASALQLDRESLYRVGQAIANTLTELEEINAVNLLVVDKAVGLDIANTLPMGALRRSTAQDLGAAYRQQLSRRVESDDTAAQKPFSASVALYFPLADTEGMVSELRALSFENQLLPDMVISILHELSLGPKTEEIASPALPLLADLLTATPTLTHSDEAGGSILCLDFAHNLYDMLEAYQITSEQCAASLCYTFCTFLPNISGVDISINGTPVDSLYLTEELEDASSDALLRAECSNRLYDYCTLHFATEDQKALAAVRRPIPYFQRTNPRSLLAELAKGPQASDSRTDLLPVMSKDVLKNTDMLGFALSDSTMLVNFAPGFSKAADEMTADTERLFAYSIVNTLCMEDRIKNVCFFQSGNQFDGFSGEIYWAGLFYPMPAE